MKTNKNGVKNEHPKEKMHKQRMKILVINHIALKIRLC